MGVYPVRTALPPCKASFFPMMQPLLFSRTMRSCGSQNQPAAGAKSPARVLQPENRRRFGCANGLEERYHGH